MTSVSARPRLVLISDGGPTPSFFLRFREPVEALGLPYTFVRAGTLLHRYVRRSGRTDLESMPMLAQADVVVFQRCATADALDIFRALRRSGKRLVYETDDFLQDLPPWSNCVVSERE
jgi:hypothetical protein